jgi:hypothetical protein
LVLKFCELGFSLSMFLLGFFLASCQLFHVDLRFCFCFVSRIRLGVRVGSV